MDFIAADTLLLAANYASKFKSTIGPEDLMVAINADKLMQDLFKSVQKLPVVERRQRISMTYSETIREMLASENQYLTNLDMIVKVFLEVFETQAGLFGEDDIRSVFGNIRDIKELTYSILTMLVRPPSPPHTPPPLPPDCRRKNPFASGTCLFS